MGVKKEPQKIEKNGGQKKWWYKNSQKLKKNGGHIPTNDLYLLLR